MRYITTVIAATLLILLYSLLQAIVPHFLQVVSPNYVRSLLIFMNKTNYYYY